MIRILGYLLMLLAGLVTGLTFGHVQPGSQSNAARRILYYKDPMHPSYKSDKPGIAPDCGMDLVPVYADDAGQSLVSDRESEAGRIAIDSAVQQLYGIRLAKVERNEGKGTIRVFARVEPDETRIYRVNFGTEGYVKETHNDAVGDFVTKNQHLATVYSPDFLAVAGGYLAAHERDPGAKNAPSSVALAANGAQEAASLQARADRLRNLGMSDAQLDEIAKTRKLPEDVYVVAPTTGFILTRNMSPGSRFDRGMDLYTIADLSKVWIVAEVFGPDAQKFRPGMDAAVTVSDTGQTIHARVSEVLPEIDPATRAMKVRLIAENPGYKLRPDMFVTVSVSVPRSQGLSIPTDAIVNSGLSKHVFVQVAEGQFEAREVEIGWQSQELVQVVKGLQAGEEVVASGTFLVDSESRIHSSSGQSGALAEAAGIDHSMQHSMN